MQPMHLDLETAQLFHNNCYTGSVVRVIMGRYYVCLTKSMRKIVIVMLSRCKVPSFTQLRGVI